ncbi:hypothetical protein Tco_0236370 [Tanacetum coccineum]
MRSMNTAGAPQGEGARGTCAAPGIKSIWNSTWRTGGMPSRISRKTSRNSLTTGVGGAIGAHGNGIAAEANSGVYFMILRHNNRKTTQKRRKGEVFERYVIIHCSSEFLQKRARKELEAQFSWSRDQGWVDGSGSNPGGGFRKPGGGRETHGGRDGLKGPGGQLSMDVVNEFSHLVVPHLRMSGGELVMLYERNVEKIMTVSGSEPSRRDNGLRICLEDVTGAKEIFPKEKFPSAQLGMNIIKVEFVGVSLKLSLSGSRNGDVSFNKIMLGAKEIAIGMIIKRICDILTRSFT